MAEAGAAAPRPRRITAAGLALGFGLGGFFDGILLHQVLQWHHLLSGVDAARQDLRVLILADGLFHLLMYLITGLGLWLLWRHRRLFAGAGADRQLLAMALVGFGAWHLLDGVLSHWVLGIHRIRMDVEDPLVWDLLWLVVFGLLPAALGWWLARGRGGGSRLLSAPHALVLAVAAAGPLAALPPPGEGPVMVLFRPGVTPAQSLAGLRAVGGRLVWSDPSDQLWAVALPEGANAVELYRYGALLVGNAILPSGCFAWLQPEVPRLPA